jgi:hypothetical protein
VEVELWFEVLEHVNASGDLSHQQVDRLQVQMTTMTAGEQSASITRADKSIGCYPNVK